MNSVLLDTSFLISLSDPARAHDAAAAMSHLISEDANTLAKYLDRARDAGLATTKAVLLRDGFDAAWFENGQTRLVP